MMDTRNHPGMAFALGPVSTLQQWEMLATPTRVADILALRRMQRQFTRPITEPKRQEMPRLDDKRRAHLLKQFRRVNHGKSVHH